jgi:hypothetical protein
VVIPCDQTWIISSVSADNMNGSENVITKSEHLIAGGRWEAV